MPQHPQIHRTFDPMDRCISSLFLRHSLTPSSYDIKSTPLPQTLYIGCESWGLANKKSSKKGFYVYITRPSAPVGPHLPLPLLASSNTLQNPNSDFTVSWTFIFTFSPHPWTFVQCFCIPSSRPFSSHLLFNRYRFFKISDQRHFAFPSTSYGIHSVFFIQSWVHLGIQRKPPEVS